MTTLSLTSISLTSIRKSLCALALLVTGLLPAAGVLLAQQQPAPAPKQKQTDDASKPPGFARQLSHETREAAGEGDDKAQFRESPSVQFIARLTGLSTGTAYILSVIFNFAVVTGIIVWAAAKYLPGAFRARTAAIQKAMQEAQKASDEARHKLAEVESRLMKLDVEIGMMRDAAEKEAAEEEERIKRAAQEDVRKMLESAQQEIAAAAKAARRGLTAYAADLAVALAKKQIRVNAATDQALVRNFAGQLGSSSAFTGDASGRGEH